ncbi:DoxX family protein [Arcobacter nitrofigilis DSM 7299]|uniref:DoxX family protein n=1 Tax=Arcobacter nitrofigilis (strain ATCC 33309 / DSM 7299 / CCUG 15893 / LMG 7604 / NCTC 12251 / CI) TaxID=572480 RepID=D5V2U8_ARCNC|nr:DoxX family protein [Arcobacter nitrofigilis]ADG92530.1 DoxX family protein [Arcobacter nitrofigilis DSM 7299]
MDNSLNENLAKLLLRLFLGFLFIFHGYAKLIHGTSFIESTLLENNLPQFLVYGVYIGEIVAPIFIIIGYYTRFFSFIIIVNIIFAIYLVHSGDLFSLAKTGGLALELQFFYIFNAFILIIMGAGKYSIDTK